MNWKKFLKPDWGKILVFVIIFLIVFLYGLSLSNLYPCAIPTCPSSQWIRLPWNHGCEKCYLTISDYINGIIYYLAFPTNLIDYIFTKPQNFLISIFLIIIQFFYYYILSCFIVWVYDKFRKKKK
jgi:hypothetical protein